MLMVASHVRSEQQEIRPNFAHPTSELRTRMCTTMWSPREAGSVFLQVLTCVSLQLYHDAIHLFDLEFAQQWRLTLWQTKSWCIAHFGNLPCDLLLRTETLDDQLTSATGNVRTNKDSLPPAANIQRKANSRNHLADSGWRLRAESGEQSQAITSRQSEKSKISHPTQLRLKLTDTLTIKRLPTTEIRETWSSWNLKNSSGSSKDRERQPSWIDFLV